MTYFDCFVLVAWTFTIGWAVGAIYMQSHNEHKKDTRVVAKPEHCLQCDGWRLPIVNDPVAGD